MNKKSFIALGLIIILTLTIFQFYKLYEYKEKQESIDSQFLLSFQGIAVGFKGIYDDPEDKSAQRFTSQTIDASNALYRYTSFFHDNKLLSSALSDLSFYLEYVDFNELKEEDKLKPFISLIIELQKNPSDIDSSEKLKELVQRNFKEFY